MNALRTERLCRQFGSLAAVREVSLVVPRGARHALIGPNGAGKTTLINLVSGSLEADSGDVFLREERVSALPAHARVKRGLARTFQVPSLFPGLTAREAVTAAVLERDGHGAAFSRPAGLYRGARDEAEALLGQLGLGAAIDVEGRHLPYGSQRLLDIALALAMRPALLLLDEPAAGIAAEDREAVFNALAALPAEVAVLFVEHDMGVVFRFAERVSVMVAGRLLAEGTPAQVAADARVREVYLGDRAWYPS